MPGKIFLAQALCHICVHPVHLTSITLLVQNARLWEQVVGNIMLRPLHRRAIIRKVLYDGDGVTARLVHDRLHIVAGKTIHSLLNGGHASRRISTLNNIVQLISARTHRGRGKGPMIHKCSIYPSNFPNAMPTTTEGG